ncbi:MAG: NUDIX domain-containing protein [Chlamydiae bacterium]|nr:NUDIX domain-containing protein [Chlamydiota bacterium]
MTSIEKKLHLGIYGLIVENKTILVIRKSRGPYKGMFDLPGGRPLHGEDLLTALTREIEEETGIKAKSFSFFGNFSHLVPYRDDGGRLMELYHVALVYQIETMDVENLNHAIIAEDVEGSLWIDIHKLKKAACSLPLISVLDSLGATEH